MNKELFNYLITVALEFKEDEEDKFDLFKNAAYFVLKHTSEITNKNQIKVLKFDKMVVDKIHHYLYAKNILSLMTIEGIGSSTSHRLFSEGINVNDLSTFKSPIILNKHQKIGIKYKKDLQKIIPMDLLKHEREKLKKILKSNKKIKEVFFDYTNEREINHAKIINVGVCGNIKMQDIIIMLKDYTKDVFYSGNKRFSAIYEDSTKTNRKLIIYIFSNCILGKFFLGGSANFNRDIRREAKRQGYKLNENEFIDENNENIDSTENKKISVTSEKVIFDTLGLRFINIKDRI
uniref:DNA-directed DNA polymerase X domain-containing protein n=1 Tax=viral metagenome TaxID=1070528 RepID=A0A6C0JDH2_9ZZZZ